MSTQNRGSGSRNQKKSNPGGGGGGGGDSNSQASMKKTDASKTEKEKAPLKPTAEQLRIAQITNSNAAEDPHMREKVATLLEMTQRSEEEVCCALNECDNNLQRAVEFLLETLPVGAFETSSKKRKNKAANVAQENAGGDGGDWGDVNANSDRREKSRNRSSNRGGRGGTDSRGWRGREARENERNLQDSRGDRGGDRGGDRSNDNYRSGSRGGRGGGRGGGYVGRGGRSGVGRMGGGRGGGDRRADRDRGGYSSRQNANDDHQEVELWDNTIAQNAEKQHQQSASDDAWGEWDNDEYVSLKDSKVFTSSNLQNQSTSGIVSGVSIVGGTTNELSAPPGLEHHLATSAAASISPSQQGSNMNVLGGGGSAADETTNLPATTSMIQYSGAVNNSQIQPQAVATSASTANVLSTGSVPQYAGSAGDSFSNSTTENLVQQVQQQQQQQQPPQLKSSATLSAEQSQYFNSLASQNAAAAAAAAAAASNAQQAQQQQLVGVGVNVNTYAAQTAGVQYPTSYANVFGTGSSSSVPNSAFNQTQMSSSQQPQVRRVRAKLPPPSKIPATAVEMPGDTLNNIGYLDVQFGALDFGPEDSFDALPEKFNATVDQQQQQQQQQQLVQSQQDATNDYSGKTNAQQQQQQQQAVAAAAVLSAGLQNSQMGDSLSAAFVPRGSSSVQQQQPQGVTNVGGGAGGGNSSSVVSSALDQFSKSDPYNQSNASGTSGYQSSYQTNTSANKAANAYQQSSSGQGYQSASYANVQSSVANSYQPQSYASYQQNSVNTYQQQQQQGSSSVSVQNASNAVSGGNAGSSGAGSSSNSSSTQNIPVGSSSNNNNATANSNTGYLSSGYQSQQSAYQSQSVYGSTGLSNNTGVSSSGAASSSGTVASSVSSVATSQATAANSMSSSSVGGLTSTKVTTNSSAANNNNAAVVSAGSLNSVSGSNNSSSSSSNAATTAAAVAAAAAAASNKSSSTASGAGGMVPNIQMVSQYIQTGLPYYQQPVYSYEEIQMMQQRVPHVQGYYDLNYTPTSLGAGRDNLGSVAYSTMTDGRFARTDNNSSPVSNVSSTMSQQAGSGGPMLNVPYAYFYGGNMMPGSFQYGTPAIYPQIPAANTATGGQFPKPSYNTGYSSTSYDTLSQASQDYSKGAYPSSVNQQTKSQNVTNPPQAGTGSDITSSMYGKGHVTLNKVNSYEKQNFHSGTPPPFNMPNTQTAGGTSAQPYGMYLPMPAAGHHNMIHQPIHQDSNSTGQRQQTSSQSKSATKQGYSPSYWTGQN